MPSYRLKPRLPLGKLCLAMALLLALPVPFAVLLPEAPPKESQVKLGDPSSWLIDANLPDGSPLYCETGDDLSFVANWNCDGTQIGTMVMKGSRDEEETLRRGIFAIDLERVDEPITLTRGKNRLIESTPELIGMSVEGEGEHEGQTLIASVKGERAREYSLLLWAKLADPDKLPTLKNPQESI